MCWVRLRPIKGDAHGYLSLHPSDLRRGGVGTWDVSWNGRPSVFHRLDQLKSGDKVRVERADGTTARSEVTRRGTFPKREFPTGEAYGANLTPRLILITCGGKYDADRRDYYANVVVGTQLVTVSG
jgi:hypothetical protein